MLANERIHHVNNPAGCPYCREYDNFFAGCNPDQDTPQQQHRRAWLEGHKDLANAQCAAFGRDRVWLQQGANNRHIIIVHDFSQVTTTEHNYQDYVVVVQERTASGSIAQSVLHFIAANHQEDHDEEFVEQAWRELLDPNTGMMHYNIDSL